MALNNILYVDDEASWRRRVQTHLKEKLAKVIDVAGDYASGVKKIKKKFYELIVLDGLGGECFRLIKDVKDVRHGQIVIFSADMNVASQARNESIPFYNKPLDLDKIVKTYKK